MTLRILAPVVGLVLLVVMATNPSNLGFFFEMILAGIFAIVFASVPVSVIIGFIGYNFGAQRRASNAIAAQQRASTPHRALNHSE